MRKVFCISLCVLLLLSCMTLPALAQDTALTISTKEDFLTFAENCRLDSYSRGLSVQLTADIDLSDAAFQGIPIFCGSFDGGGHTISGVKITTEGSRIGFFRYVTEGATVTGLTVNGTVAPGGSANRVGGIAGFNAGTLNGCIFQGEVVGADNAGGIAGSNALTGIIEDSASEAVVSGNHFVGGIAGESSGVIRGCTNRGSINTTEKQNKVELSDITIDTLTNVESTMTVTDIGGIAGTSSGVIRGSENRGDVGYPHIGYNIGGIAGSQSGFLTECSNYGTVHGRKDVGGIVGHLVPNTALIFQEDTLQILRNQLEELAALTDKAGTNADSTSAALRTQLSVLDRQVNDAKDAADRLLPREQTLPDPDSIIAAGNDLGSSLTGIGTTLGNISSQTESGAQSLVSDIDAIAKQMDKIEKTLETGEENMQGEVADISDLDTEKDTAAKVSHCANSGTVNGDRNIGGIAGVIGFENDLDPESDLDISGSLSLNQACNIRAVIRACSNNTAVNGKKQNTGGIVGLMSLGLVRDSTNTGAVTAPDGDFTGGITGRAPGGYIRCCFVKAPVTGTCHTGGIAGTATVVTGCRAMVRLTGKEATGAILGSAEDRSQVTGNYYLPAGTDTGAIDGISYDGCAQPLTPENFLTLESLPELFETNTVTFCFPDGTQQVITVPQGSSLDSTQIPQVPAQDGSTGVWVGTNDEVLDNILFDSLFQVSYTSRPITLASDALRENGQPVLLAQGSFLPGSRLTAEEIRLDDRMEACLEAWQVTLPEDTTELRYLLPANCHSDNVILRLQNAEGDWYDVPFSTDGSYLVFSVQGGETGLQLVNAPADYTWLMIGSAGILVLAAAMAAILLIQRKKKKKS